MVSESNDNLPIETFRAQFQASFAKIRYSMAGVNFKPVNLENGRRISKASCASIRHLLLVNAIRD